MNNDSPKGVQKAAKPMRLIDVSFNTPDKNLAYDEALLDAVEAGARDEVLRFWESSSLFVVLGVSPAVSGQTVVTRVGAAPARARMLDPGLISGEEAARIGLVTDLVEEPGAVLPAAMALAGELGAKGPHALAATKRWLGALDGTTAGGGPDGLGVSLGLAGGVEEGELLKQFWSRRG